MIGLWKKGTILNTKAEIYMHHISTEKEYFPLSIDIYDFESKYGGRNLKGSFFCFYF